MVSEAAPVFLAGIDVFIDGPVELAPDPFDVGRFEGHAVGVGGVPQRYLEGFHEVGEEERREEHRAFIPVANGALRGLWKVNGDMVGFVWWD